MDEARKAAYDEFRDQWFSDAQFKEEFQRQVEGLLPNIGDSELMPVLLTLHITDFEPVVYGVDYHMLAMDDFNDAERRHYYVGMLGERQAMEGRKVVMAVMASEVWTAQEQLRPDGSRRYKQPSDDPDRKEAIAVFAMSLDLRSAMASCRLTRTLGGKFKTFGQLDISYSFEPEGTLSGMRPVLLEKFWKGFTMAAAADMGLI